MGWDMKAMIFAAGLGTRLKPITDTLPKALVPVCGKPLVGYVMDKLSAASDPCTGAPLFTEAVVNVHHFADKLEAWVDEYNSLGNGGLSSHVSVSDERAMLLETGGAVLHARPYLEGCGKFLIHNVDIFSNADLGWFASQVREDALATLLVSDRETSRFLLFEPASMRLVGWYNKSTGDSHLTDSSMRMEDCRALGFSGIHILSEQVLDVMEEYVACRGLEYDRKIGAKFSIMNFYMYATSRYPVYGVEAEGLEFLDVGKLDTLEKAEQFIKK